jgi:hypothetical protein
MKIQTFWTVFKEQFLKLQKRNEKINLTLGMK